MTNYRDIGPDTKGPVRGWQHTAFWFMPQSSEKLFQAGICLPVWPGPLCQLRNPSREGDICIVWLLATKLTSYVHITLLILPPPLSLSFSRSLPLSLWSRGHRLFLCSGRLSFVVRPAGPVLSRCFQSAHHYYKLIKVAANIDLKMLFPAPTHFLLLFNLLSLINMHFTYHWPVIDIPLRILEA